MKFAIVGAGFVGLSAAWELLKKGHSVVIFEKNSVPGGLATGFKQSDWDWSLEKHYHHIFTSDKHIQKLADELGYPYHFYNATTSSLFESNSSLEYWRLDSPLALLAFERLPFPDRVRTGAVIAYLKYLADWKKLEQQTAAEWLEKWNGNSAYQELWKPLFAGKFGPLMDEVNAAWFWARIKSRSQQLGYFDGGFLGLAQEFLDQVKKRGAQIKLNTEIKNLSVLENKFDKILLAGVPNLVKQPVKYLGTINVILQLKEKFLPDNIYWLSNHIVKYPMLALVEHTNLIDKSHYADQHLLYIAKYLPHDDPFMKMSDKQILSQYAPLLTRINSKWQKNLIDFTVHRAMYTQPVMPVNYSKEIPDFKTENPKIFAAGMQQVYPWDRGTNYAVSLGQQLANLF
jgi:protoporphyrinogen oxidase